MKYFLVFLLTIFQLSASTTFFVATDAHYGKNQWSENEDKNKQAIYDMNKLPTQLYPDSDKAIDIPKGVILTGDLTDAGFYWHWHGFSILRFLNWDGFIDDYGLNGEALLNFPVFEGFGNHDTLGWGDWVKWDIKNRNLNRSESLNLSDNGYHYSWDWEGVHYVQLNVYPGDSEEAEYSLPFLKKDLKENLQNPNMPIILFQHYGFDGYSDDWWSNEERQQYYEAIKDYNILAIFQGHQHDAFHIVWKGIDVFSSGDVQSNEYLVCNIEDNIMKIFLRFNNDWDAWRFEKTFEK